MAGAALGTQMQVIRSSGVPRGRRPGGSQQPQGCAAGTDAQVVASAQWHGSPGRSSASENRESSTPAAGVGRGVVSKGHQVTKSVSAFLSKPLCSLHSGIWVDAI